jgi:hypothetical protein
LGKSSASKKESDDLRSEKALYEQISTKKFKSNGVKVVERYSRMQKQIRGFLNRRREEKI